MDFSDQDDNASNDLPRLEEPPLSVPFLPYPGFDFSNELADAALLNGSFPVNFYPFASVGSIPELPSLTTQQSSSIQQDESFSSQLQTSSSQDQLSKEPVNIATTTIPLTIATPSLPGQTACAGQKRSLSQISSPENHHVFTLVVGGRVFRLSWESIKSDGPSNFFTDYFTKHKTRIMHIDRDPDSFRLVAHHLRGYYARPSDDLENQHLISDARYYNLKRLEMLLKEYLFVNVGGRVFRLSWDLLSKYGTQNYFTGPMKDVLHSPHASEAPPVFIDRDPDNFVAITNHLRGYAIRIKDELHRKNLIKDAKYYGFRQLVEKLLSSRCTVEGFGEQSSSDILLQIFDARPANLVPSKAQEVGSVQKSAALLTEEEWERTRLLYKWKSDRAPRAFLVQLANMEMRVHRCEEGISLCMVFHQQDIQDHLRHMARSFKEGSVDARIHLDRACAMTVNNEPQQSLDNPCMASTDQRECDLHSIHSHCSTYQWILQRAICSVHFIGDKLTLCAVRLELVSPRVHSNTKYEFLPAL